MKKIVQNDLDRIYNSLTGEEKSKFTGSIILLTGCAGFLGFYFLHFFARFREELGIAKIIGLDNFISGYPQWIAELGKQKNILFYDFDVITGNIREIPEADKAVFVFHMASIASPAFYRIHPIETLDANIWGLRYLLEFYKDLPIKGFVFFSTSEIYGDPDPKMIPTPEDYRGNVACIGPRACYDESKRVGETLCYLFAEKYNMPIRLVRPFNNYGPGMKLNDKRVPADFAKAILENRDIVMFSDGTPTRTFCYISDAVTGYLKALLYHRFDVFNIGIDEPEISIYTLAQFYQRAGQEIFGYKGELKFETSKDINYLKDNPNRRCPDITKARNLLGYNPLVHVEDGVRYFLEYVRESIKEELEW